MSTSVRCTVVAIAVAIAFGAIAASAPASRSLSLNPAGSITATSQGLLTLSFIRGLFHHYCSMQMSGTLARTIAKTPSTPAGTVTAASIGCHPTGGGGFAATTLLGSGWPITYRGFGGTLPSPSSVELTIEDVQFHHALFNCLWQGDLDLSVRFSGSPNVSGAATSLRSDMWSVQGCVMVPVQIWGAFSIRPQQTLVLLN